MNIILEIKDNEINLFLQDKKKVIDAVNWGERLDLSEKLLIAIDGLLVKNNLQIQDIEKMSVKSSISDKLTSVRIAKTVAETFNFFKSC